MAEKISLNVQFNIEENVEKFQAKLKELGAQFKTLETEMKTGANTTQQFAKQTSVVSDAIQESTKQFITSTKNIDSNAEAINNDTDAKKSATKVTDDNTKTVDKNVKSVEKSTDVQSENIKTILDTKVSYQSLSSELSQVANRFAALSAISFGALKDVLGTAKDLESAFAGVKKTMDDADVRAVYGANAWNKLRKELESISEVTASTPEEIFGVAEAAGQLGVSAEDVTTFTKTMIKLGDTTNMTAQDAATQISRLGNILNVSGEDFERLGSVIVDLGNNAAATEGEISNVLERWSAMGKIVGMSVPEITAIGTAMVSVGIRSENAGTSMMTTLTQIEKAVDKGGKKLQAFANIAGMSAEDFKKEWKDNATDALLAFLKGLRDADKEGESAILLLDKAGITQKRQTQTLLSLSQAYGKVSGFVKRANEAWRENTALDIEAEKRYATLQTSLTRFNSAVIVLRDKMGSAITTPTRVLLDVGTKLTQMFSNAPAPILATADAVLILTSAFGGVATATASAMSTFFMTLGALKTFNDSEIFTAFNANDILSKFDNLIKGIRIKIGEIPKIFSKIGSFGDSVATPFKETGNFLKTSLLEPFETFGDDIANIFKTFGGKASGLFKGLGDGFKSVLGVFTKTLPNTFGAIFSDMFSGSKIGSLFSKLTKGLTGMFKGLGSILGKGLPFAGIVAGITLAIGAFTLLNGGVDNAKQKIMDFASNAATKISEFADKLPELLSGLGEKAPEILNTIFDALINGLPKMMDAGVQILQTLLQAFVDNMPKIVESATTILETIVETLAENLPKVIAGAVALVGALVTGLIKSLPSIVKAAGTLLAGLLSAIIVGVSSMVSAGWSLIKGAVKGLKKGLSDVIDIGKNLVVGIWDGITNKFQWIVGKIKQFCSDVKDKLKSFFGIESPSKWTRDWIGKNLALGVGIGFEDNMKIVNKKMTDALNGTLSKVDNKALSSLDRAIAKTYEIGAVAQNNINVGFDYDRLAQALGDRGIYLNGRLVGRELDKMGVAFK